MRASVLPSRRLQKKKMNSQGETLPQADPVPEPSHEVDAAHRGNDAFCRAALKQQYQCL
jgi:hypothetical protein